MPQCQARSKRTGERCQRPATVHDGRYCYYHGGAKGSGVNPDKPVQITHGRYSKSLPTDLRDKYEYFKTDPEVFSLVPDIALLRAFLDKYLEPLRRADEDGSKLPVDGKMREEIREFADAIGRLAERAHKIQHGETYTITVQGFQSLLARVADVVNSAIDEHGGSEELRAAIADGLARVGNKQ